MGLFKKKGRADIEAWAKALIQGYKKGMPVDRSVLEKEMDQIGCLNQQIKIKNDMLKENAREKRKRKQDAFGEVTGSSYMMDEFSNSQKKR